MYCKMPSRMIHLGFTWAAYCVITNQASACCARDENRLDRGPTCPRTRPVRRGASAELAASRRCGSWASGTHSASVCQGMSSSRDRAHSRRAAGDPASGCIDSRDKVAGPCRSSFGRSQAPPQRRAEGLHRCSGGEKTAWSRACLCHPEFYKLAEQAQKRAVVRRISHECVYQILKAASRSYRSTSS